MMGLHTWEEEEEVVEEGVEVAEEEEEVVEGGFLLPMDGLNGTLTVCWNTLCTGRTWAAEGTA